MENLSTYKAAATVAHAMRQGMSPPADALLWLSWGEQQAKDALADFGATRYLRQLPEKPSQAPADLLGQNLVLYKAPQPGEQQAKLSYEYLLEQFSQYVRRKASAVVVSESAAHVALWLPEGVTLELPEMWQAFITEMTSPEGFSKGFGLVMNSSKLSDRGFGTLETPMISASQPLAVASFYLANLEQVRQRLRQRQSKIDAAIRDITQSEDDKERSRLDKQRQKDQAMQDKEQAKYQGEFTKMFDKLLEAESKTHAEIVLLEQAIQDAAAASDAKTIKKLEKKRDKLTKTFSLDTFNALQATYQPNPFVFMDALSKYDAFRETWQHAKQTAKRFTTTAASQLSTQKGDIYAKVIWETCALLFGEPQVVTLEPLLQAKPIVWQARKAGDDARNTCYSCGRLLEQGAYDSRRLAFQSPDQRAQSSGSSSPVKICHACAALSILCPVKFAPDTLVIRFDPETRRVNDFVQQALEQQALNEIGAVAGRYINLTCTERQTDGTLAVQKLGMKQYATAKLASLYPATVLEHLRPSLYDGGTEVRLRPAVLVGCAVLMATFSQHMMQSNSKGQYVINDKLGTAVRLLEADAFVEASYTLAKAASRQQAMQLENGTASYVNALAQEVNVEGNMKHETQQDKLAKVQILADVHAMIGLMMPFCRQLLAREDLGMNIDTKWREIGKLIQSIDENPTVFSYNASKTVGGVGSLVRDSNTHFVFDKAQELIGELGDIPEFVPKAKKGVVSGNSQDQDDASNDETNSSTMSVPDEQANALEGNKLRVTTDLIARAYEHILSREIDEKKLYATEYDLKSFFYQVRLGLLARFSEAAKPRSKGDK